MTPHATDRPEPALSSLYEKQQKIYPRAVTGVFARWRWVMVWLTQLFFYGMPWLQWNGRQALLLWASAASMCWAWCCSRRTSSTWRPCW